MNKLLYCMHGFRNGLADEVIIQIGIICTCSI